MRPLGHGSRIVDIDYGEKCWTLDDLSGSWLDRRRLIYGWVASSRLKMSPGPVDWIRVPSCFMPPSSRPFASAITATAATRRKTAQIRPDRSFMSRLVPTDSNYIEISCAMATSDVQWIVRGRKALAGPTFGSVALPVKSGVRNRARWQCWQNQEHRFGLTARESACFRLDPPMLLTGAGPVAAR
jgi:hypothetical protein